MISPITTHSLAVSRRVTMVYNGASRTWLTERGAYMDVARQMWKRRHRKLGCDKHFPGVHELYCEGCDLSSDPTKKTIARLARWLRWRDRKRTHVATWLYLFGLVLALPRVPPGHGVRSGALLRRIVALREIHKKIERTG